MQSARLYPRGPRPNLGLRARRYRLLASPCLRRGEWRNLADAQDSGFCGRKAVGVRVPPRPPIHSTGKVWGHDGAVPGHPVGGGGRREEGGGMSTAAGIIVLIGRILFSINFGPVAGA